MGKRYLIDTNIISKYSNDIISEQGCLFLEDIFDTEILISKGRQIEIYQSYQVINFWLNQHDYFTHCNALDAYWGIQTQILPQQAHKRLYFHGGGYSVRLFGF